jgi:hypothetical protein
MIWRRPPQLRSPTSCRDNHLRTTSYCRCHRDLETGLSNPLVDWVYAVTLKKRPTRLLSCRRLIAPVERPPSLADEAV